MSLPSRIKEAVRRAGACAVGFAPLREVDPEVFAAYRRWLAGGNHASMGYLENHLEIRRNPALLLEGDPAEGTVICAAFPYVSAPDYRPGAVRIARYALGDDYHEVLRERLRPVADLIRGETGCQARICVDTAPLLERYWARESGIGFIGRNRHLIVPGGGSYVFLAEIVTDLPLPPDAPCLMKCDGCDACMRVCPHGALQPGCLDARRCLSCLTIEHRGPLPPEYPLAPGRVYGCDLCQEVCPHNRASSLTSFSPLPEFLPRPSLLELTPRAILSLSQEDFSALFRRSAVKRTRLAGLLRNAAALK